jgi:hypothetical protein
VNGYSPNGFPEVKRSWMAPDAKQQSLLYVSDLNSGDVGVFSYPRGRRKGKLTGFSSPHGLCVDKKGDVFVTSEGTGNIIEFAHGGSTPIATLADPGYMPNGCSIDPTNGNLAVANIFADHSGGGSIAVFKNAAGTPKIYTASNMFYYYFCGYDASGNLFVDGQNYHGVVALAELPARSKKMTPINVNQQIQYPGGIQWDGKYVAVVNRYYLSGPSVIYQFTINGSQATLAGTTQLGSSCDVLQFWIDGKRVIAPSGCTPYVQYFSYPAGGAPTKSIRDANEAVGATVSNP